MSDQLRLFLPEAPVVITPASVSEPDGELWGYFFGTRNGSRVKHGITGAAIERRRRELQTGNGDPLVLMGAYPGYSETLEKTVRNYFARLKTEAENEWFEPWTVEFRITALGWGIPPTIYEQWLAARTERTRLLGDRGGPSVQARVSELIASEGWRESREAERCISDAMQEFVNRNQFEAMQPLEVRVAQSWERRLNGQDPFDLDRAELRPAFVDLSQLRLRER